MPEKPRLSPEFIWSLLMLLSFRCKVISTGCQRTEIVWTEIHTACTGWAKKVSQFIVAI